MSKNQFWILNALAGICAVLFLTNIILTPLTSRLGETVTQTQGLLQSQYNEAQQKQGTLQNLAVRLAQKAQTEPALLELLRKYGVQVNLSVGANPNQQP